MNESLVTPQDQTASERMLKEFSNRVYIIRNFSIFVLFIAIIQLIVACALPDVLSPTLKIWVLSIVGSVLIMLMVAHVLARRDTAVILFINFITPCVSGIVTGIALTIIILKIEN